MPRLRFHKLAAVVVLIGFRRLDGDRQVLVGRQCSPTEPKAASDKAQTRSEQADGAGCALSPW